MFIKDFKNAARHIIRKRVSRELVSIIIAIPVSYYAMSSWQNRFAFKGKKLSVMNRMMIGNT